MLQQILHAECEVGQKLIPTTLVVQPYGRRGLMAHAHYFPPPIRAGPEGPFDSAPRFSGFTSATSVPSETPSTTIWLSVRCLMVTVRGTKPLPLRAYTT